MSLKLWLHTKESWSAARLRCGVHDIGNQQQLQQGSGRGASEMSALAVACGYGDGALANAGYGEKPASEEGLGFRRREIFVAHYIT